MTRLRENAGFTCVRCGYQVAPLTNGSYRNHCPACLYSRHVDVEPGDRASTCGGPMAPVSLLKHKKKGWQIVHRYERCGVTRRNRVATDTIQPDDLARMLALF